jgi:hypothetical protein
MLKPNKPWNPYILINHINFPLSHYELFIFWFINFGFYRISKKVITISSHTLSFLFWDAFITKTCIIEPKITLGDKTSFITSRQLKFMCLWERYMAEDLKKRWNLKFVGTKKGTITKKQNFKMIWICTTNIDIQVLAKHTYVLHKIQVARHTWFT